MTRLSLCNKIHVSFNENCFKQNNKSVCLKKGLPVQQKLKLVNTT